MALHGIIPSSGNRCAIGPLKVTESVPVASVFKLASLYERPISPSTVFISAYILIGWRLSLIAQDYAIADFGLGQL